MVLPRNGSAVLMPGDIMEGYGINSKLDLYASVPLSLCA